MLVDEEVDLSSFKSNDPLPTEQLLPDEDVPAPRHNLNQETINAVFFYN